MTDDDLVAIRVGGFSALTPVPALLAEVHRLQEERRGMVAESSWDELAAEMTEVEADNARLRAERAAMLDVIEAADEYATWGGKENRKILFDALARARDLARRRT
jgi:hypothetical protein